MENITYREIHSIVYYQVATLLEDGSLSAEYPILNDWHIKWGENDNESDNIWNLQIWLYKGDTYVDCFAPFSYCETYAELAKGELDCIQSTANAILDKIYKVEE